MEFLTKDDIIRINKLMINDIRVKKADQHKVISEGALEWVVKECRANDDDIYGVAICYLKGIIQKHPFDSANRRTAWAAVETFLEENHQELNIDNSGKQARVLQGIREDYYSDEEIREWFKSGKIREFKR